MIEITISCQFQSINALHLFKKIFSKHYKPVRILQVNKPAAVFSNNRVKGSHVNVYSLHGLLMNYTHTHLITWGWKMRKCSLVRAKSRDWKEMFRDYFNGSQLAKMEKSIPDMSLP